MLNWSDIYCLAMETKLRLSRFVGDAMFFGQDRLEFVREELLAE